MQGAAPTGAPEPARSGLRAWIREKTDLAFYRPQAIPDAVTSRLTDRAGPYVILKNPRARTYYRLAERDQFLWQRMDGTRTVKDLVVAYFLEFGSLAFARVSGLVRQLKASLLLTDQPVGAYSQVYARLERRKPRARLMAVVGALMGRQFAIGGLDRFVTSAYRVGGRLLFTRPALVLYVLLAAAGIGCFYRAFRSGGWGVVTIGGSYVWGMIGLISANLASIFVHEMGHALTVKRYGREVRRGGFLFYFGTPGFFVDTTDIWLEGKRARLAVTWAGPYTGLVLGGLASIVLVAWPSFALNPLLFQFAFLTYLNVFFNLNPLLELDGYYLLMDALEIPALRRKSLEFLRTGLAARLRTLRSRKAASGTPGRRPPVREVLASFSREERIFSVFGLLSTAWSAYAIVMVIDLYRQRLLGAVQSLWAEGEGAGRMLLAGVMVLLSLAVVVGMGMAVWGMVRGLVRSAARRGLFRGWNLAAVLLGAAALLSAAEAAQGPSAWWPALGLVALVGSALLAGWQARELTGSHRAPAFWLLATFALGSLATELVALTGERNWLGPSVSGVLIAGLGSLAGLALVAFGLALLSRTDLKVLRGWERALWVVAGVASLGVTVWAVSWQAGAIGPGDAGAWLRLGRSWAPLLALVLAAPALASFRRAGSAPAWALLGLSLVAFFAAAALRGVPAILPPLLLAGSLGAFRLLYAEGDAGQGPPAPTLELTDPQRMAGSFAWALQCLYGEGRRMASAHEVRSLVEQLNRLADAAGWQIQMVDGRVRDRHPADWTLQRQGEVYGAALTLVLDLMARRLGEKRTVRALQRAYDGLPWDQREVAAQYVFSHVRRAERLGRDFHSARQDRSWLLRRIPLFALMDQTELDLLNSSLRVERFAPGRTILRQGDPGDRFYIVQEGQVEVTQCSRWGVTEVVNQHGRGGYFGELALLNDAPRNATCRATVPTQLLSLSRAEFDRLVRTRFAMRSKVDRSLVRAELLRRMPLFAELDAHQVGLIAARMRDETYEPGEILMREGEPGNTFYVIESGRVQALVGRDAGERVVAERGAGEYVGEIALLAQVPRTATVRAMTRVQALALDRADFDGLVASHLYASRELEREASRRVPGIGRMATSAQLAH